MGSARSKYDNKKRNKKNDDLTGGTNEFIDSPIVSTFEVTKGQLAQRPSVGGEPLYKSSKLDYTLPADIQKYQLQHHSKQRASLWSFDSLNWSFTISGNSSLKKQSRHRLYNRSLSGNINQRQQQERHRCRSKTYWHKPLTNSIFSTHFKDCSRNQEFYVEGLIGKGAFGVVFKVTQKPNGSASPSSTSCVYALKILRKHKVIAENSIQQIKDEAKIQQICGHNPFIVKQIDLWQNRHNLYILTEYMPNGELFGNLQYFSLDLIRIYTAEIALALDFLHNAGIIYRDVKPENILLTYDYHLKLTDFGLSKWLKIGETTRTICGTLQYTAPELLKGLPYNHAVDWWSLGVVIYEMFMMEAIDVRQFIIDNDEDTILRRAGKFNGLPDEGQDILKRLLRIDPQCRIRSVRDLQKIAMYKNFKIETDVVLKMNPLDIIRLSSCNNLKHEQMLTSSMKENF